MQDGEDEDSDCSSDEDEVLQVLEDTSTQKKLRKKAATYEDLKEPELRSRRKNPPENWKTLNKSQMIDFLLADDEEEWRNEDWSIRTLARRIQPETLGNVAEISEQELQDPVQIFWKMFPDTLVNLIVNNTNRSYQKEARTGSVLSRLNYSPITPKH
jgi:hypothetical protein